MINQNVLNNDSVINQQIMLTKRTINVTILTEEVENMLNAFGKFSRKLRIEHNEVLKDMAKKLGVTSAYLSAVEVGKRNIPTEWFESISMNYNLSQIEQSCLRKAIDSSIKQLKIDLDNYSEMQRETAAVFARKLEELDEQDIKKLFEVFNKP